MDKNIVLHVDLPADVVWCQDYSDLFHNSSCLSETICYLDEGLDALDIADNLYLILREVNYNNLVSWINLLQTTLTAVRRAGLMSAVRAKDKYLIGKYDYTNLDLFIIVTDLPF